MVVETLWAPVIHQHAQIQIVGNDLWAVTGHIVIRSNSTFNVLAIVDHGGGTFVDSDRRSAGRTRHTFLQSGAHRIQLQIINRNRHAAQSCRRVHV